jgi:hypothetical protein
VILLAKFGDGWAADFLMTEAVAYSWLGIFFLLGLISGSGSSDSSGDEK